MTDETIIKCLEAENNELKNVISDLRKEIDREGAKECGCIIIEGSQRSAAYQDLVGVLLRNGYGVELTPMRDNKLMKVVIKECEE